MDLEMLDIELVEMYLDDEMDVQERAAFEARVLKDKELKHKLETQRLLRGGMKHLAMKDFLQEVSQWEQELQATKSPSSPVLRLWVPRLAIAAAALLIVFLITNWMIGNQNPNEELIERYYAAIEIESNRRGGMAAQLEELFNIEKVNCNTIMPLKDTLSPGTRAYVYAHAFAGDCYMEQKTL